MAHGIAGPLALMSIAARRDITVPGQLDAIDQISAWLDSWRIGTDAHTWWPGMISLPEYRDQAVHHASRATPVLVLRDARPGTCPTTRRHRHR